MVVLSRMKCICQSVCLAIYVRKSAISTEQNVPEIRRNSRSTWPIVSMFFLTIRLRLFPLVPVERTANASGLPLLDYLIY